MKNLNKISTYFCIFNSSVKNRGFTLVESVIAISIVGIIGIIMADILGRTFDSNEKTTLISNVQQNGQTSLNTLDDAVRNSQFVCLGGYDGYGTTAAVRTPNQANFEYFDPILVVLRNGSYIRYRMVTETSSENGFVAEDYPVVTSTVGLTNGLCNPTSTTPAFIPFSNTTRKLTNDSAISLKKGSIMLLSNPSAGFDSVSSSKVALTISFSIGPSRNAPTNESNSIGPNNEIEFKTTTQFR